MEVKFTGISECVVCGSHVDKVIDLPNYPITDIYVDRPESALVNQGLAVCPKCGHSQLTTAVDPEILYGRAYSFRTTVGGSTTVNNNLLKFIGNRKFDRIVEIGCNDCYLLNMMRSVAPRLIGIDPVIAGREQELSDHQITAIGDFVENIDLPREDNTLYITSHVMEHLNNPRSMVEKLLKSAGNNCLFVFQFPGFDSLLQDFRFDQVYNHHLHYFSLHSIICLIESVGCKLQSYNVDSHYWGTLLVAFEPKAQFGYPSIIGRRICEEDVVSSYSTFVNMMQNTNTYIKSFRGDLVYGYGASLQVPVISYHLGNDFSGFECIVDDDKKKDGKYFINLTVPIRHSSKVDLCGAVVFITAHNFSGRIIPKVVATNPKRIILLNNGI